MCFMDTSGNSLKKIYTLPEIDEMVLDPQISPDGKYIVFQVSKNFQRKCMCANGPDLSLTWD